MRDISTIPRISLAQLPTPLYRLPNISAPHRQKRIHQTGRYDRRALGGNKVRKLEFLLAHALEEGCDYVLTPAAPRATMPCSPPPAATGWGYTASWC